MNNKTEKRKTGDLGEEVACKFLVKHGFKVIDRNYLRKYGEIDIVVTKGKMYHFVEVKTVTFRQSMAVSHETGEYRPEDNVHPWKLKRLSRVIQAYILDKKLFDADWTVDIVTVLLDMEKRIGHVRIMEDIVL